MDSKKELSASKLNKVSSGFEAEMETYQESCQECGYVFYEEQRPKGASICPRFTCQMYCPRCQDHVEVRIRVF